MPILQQTVNGSWSSTICGRCVRSRERLRISIILLKSIDYLALLERVYPFCSPKCHAKLDRSNGQPYRAVEPLLQPVAHPPSPEVDFEISVNIFGFHLARDVYEKHTRTSHVGGSALADSKAKAATASTASPSSPTNSL